MRFPSMKFLIKLVLPLIKNYLLQELVKEENRSFVVAKLNDHVDLPNLSESEEAEVIENIYNALTKILESYLGINK